MKGIKYIWRKGRNVIAGVGTAGLVSVASAQGTGGPTAVDLNDIGGVASDYIGYAWTALGLAAAVSVAAAGIAIVVRMIRRAK